MDPVKRLRVVAKNWEYEAKQIRRDAALLIVRAEEIEKRSLQLEMEMDKLPETKDQPS